MASLDEKRKAARAKAVKSSVPVFVQAGEYFFEYKGVMFRFLKSEKLYAVTDESNDVLIGLYKILMDCETAARAVVDTLELYDLHIADTTEVDRARLLDTVKRADAIVNRATAKIYGVRHVYDITVGQYNVSTSPDRKRLYIGSWGQSLFNSDSPGYIQDVVDACLSQGELWVDNDRFLDFSDFDQEDIAKFTFFACDVLYCSRGGQYAD